MGTENDGRSAVNGWNGAQDEGERKDEEEGNDNGYIVLLFHHVILCLAFHLSSSGAPFTFPRISCLSPLTARPPPKNHPSYAWRLYAKTRNHGKGMLEVISVR